MAEAIDLAIAQLEATIVDSGQGTKRQPKPGTIDWYLLRATALGLSHLRDAKRRGVHTDPAAHERLYLAQNKAFKGIPLPDPITVAREKLPDGTLPTGQETVELPT